MIWLTQRLQDGSFDPNWIGSKCGRFTVARITVNSTVRFEAWLLTKGRPSRMIGWSHDADDAKTICETYSRRPS